MTNTTPKRQHNNHCQNKKTFSWWPTPSGININCSIILPQEERQREHEDICFESYKTKHGFSLVMDVEEDEWKYVMCET